MPTKRDANLKHSQYYVEVLLRAESLYEEGGDGIVYGLRMFDDNWKNIEIGQKWAARRAGTDEVAGSLVSEYPERGARCLYMRQKPTERIVWFEAALDIAHSRGFELVEGSLHGKIGLALTEKGEYQKAIEHYSIQLRFAEKLNDFEGLGEGACNLGILYDSLDMLGPAQECYQYALDLAEKISNQKITEAAMGNLGLVYLKQGKFKEAMDCFERHLQLARQNGDQWSEGNALTNMGIACLKLQNYDQASTCFYASLLINKKLGDLAGEAKNLSYIGSVLDVTENLGGAVSAYQARIVLAHKLNDFRGESIGNWNLGKILIKQKKYKTGLELLYRCIEYEKSVGDPAWEDDLKAVKTVEEAYDGAE
jgi:tetratricopeptide (TPR) repeat protein